ncbi:MAG: glycosyltransferase family 87 protein [Anaerolineaceae bacterium]|nr:glycosyltransferase family 87 protein [Anaerolineaceae bacterium]
MNRRPFPTRYLPFLALLLLLALYTLAGWVTEAHYLRVFGGGLYMFDFRVYERALQDALAHKDPYLDRTIGTAFLYPPPALLIIQLLALLPQGVRYLVVDGLYLTLLLLAVHLVRRTYRLPLAQTWWWYWVAAFLGPTLEALTIGQINAIPILGMTVLFAWEKRSQALSGLGLALAVLTKMSPLVLAGYLVCQRRWRILLWAGVCMLGAILLTGLAYGFQHFAAFAGALSSAARFSTNDLNLQSLAAKLGALGLLPIDSKPTFQTGLALYLGAVLLLSAACHSFTREGEPLFVLSVFAMTLYPNIVWYHHYMFLLVPLFILIAWSGQNRLVLAWAAALLLVIQVDRYRLTSGLLIHAMGHLTILGLLAYQVKQAIPAARRQAALVWSRRAG